MPPPVLDAGVRQMRFSADCSSANTVVAPTSSMSEPPIVPIRPLPGWLALRTMPWTAAAASGPSDPDNSANSRPDAASSPKTNPDTAMTMSSSGAIENTV
jgi:hypothetical protein